jgi:hypothetical protein
MMSGLFPFRGRLSGAAIAEAWRFAPDNLPIIPLRQSWLTDLLPACDRWEA